MHRRLIAVPVLALVAACSQDTAGPAASEMVLAQQAQGIAQDLATTASVSHDGWIRRLHEALRHTDDPQAQACLAEATELRHQARAAAEAGDRELARELLRAAFLKVLCAVVEVFPDAPERTAAVVDQIISRIEERLGDREAPRIRRVLAHVMELRDAADEALAAGNQIEALALNVRALQILDRLVDHMRDAHDHDRIADDQMHAAAF
jgi:hypothetical protein